MKDFGYDVADYTAIHPLFGTLTDFDRLIARGACPRPQSHPRFCPQSHVPTSIRGSFESRSSRDNPKRDWYIWRDPGAGGGPPNNWLSCFGGSAWEYDAPTEQYYYHAFLREQPDLNWRNPEVVEAMLDVLRFWLERGVDGFRVDVLWHLIEDDQFSRQSSQPKLARGHGPLPKVDSALHHGSIGGARSHCAHAGPGRPSTRIGC